VIYVADASRAVGVATTLLSQEMRGEFIADQRAEYNKIRERLANKQPKAAKLSYTESVENGLKIDGKVMYHLYLTLLGHRSSPITRSMFWSNTLTGHHSLFHGVWQANSRKF
jgi:cobalamin-dependent methionine synthase I